MDRTSRSTTHDHRRELDHRIHNRQRVERGISRVPEELRAYPSNGDDISLTVLQSIHEVSGLCHLQGQSQLLSSMTGRQGSGGEPALDPGNLLIAAERFREEDNPFNTNQVKPCVKQVFYGVFIRKNCEKNATCAHSLKVLKNRKRSASFILDTGDFLQCIRDLHRVPPNTLLVTLDVKDLYTSIPHLNGINAVHQSLTAAGLDTDQINLCIELLTTVLYNNFFLFQDSFYLQRRGTAMGSNVAPPYANTYMALFETSVIYKHPLFIHNVSVWKRYIDDVFCLWGGSLESLQEFFLFLNDAWPGIKFTISHDQNAINFLDTTVLKDSAGLLTTDLYSKPTDRNSLLYTTRASPTIHETLDSYITIPTGQTHSPGSNTL
ncbi:unnamed protein product [Ranitomeya imitator]|uniref:Reverse transcriptase domain-containing protein n=1 Tax=Ranitomeya imitator TaxID=111125 RepID=A0ABN9LXB1_9NEOB|nr:unnamed protein product [Ranitomeya imitator]